MLTYRLQRRGFRVKSGTLRFPSDVRVEFRLAPAQPFGSSPGPGRTLAQGKSAPAVYDANTGRITASPESNLAPVDVTHTHPNQTVTVKGDLLVFTTRCESLQDLDEIISSIYFFYPMILNLEFADSPVVLSVGGSVGDAVFGWELIKGTVRLDITNTERQEARVSRAWSRIQLFTGIKNRRLAAALHYFHVACRLAAAGQSLWEFMPETILNLAKTLQALFGQSRDHVRAGLSALGFSSDDIERFYIPVMVLRDEFDVGHVMIATLEEGELQGLYRSVEDLEFRFRALLVKAMEAIEQGTYVLPPETDLTLDADKKRIIQRIIKTNDGPSV
jgi:hypothetical protein